MIDILSLMCFALSEPQTWLWVIYVTIPGWCLLPVFCRLLPYSRAAWYFMAKIAGMGIIAYVSWFLSHDMQKASGIVQQGIVSHLANGPGLLMFNRATLVWIYTFVCFAGAISWLWWGRQTLHKLHRRVKVFAAGEAIFILAFAFGGALCLVSHGIVGQEKFMDMAFFRSCIDSSSMPPFDPWLFHLPINYYYGGYAILATPAKLLSTPPETAYNLALALIFALTASMIFALGIEILARIRWALLTVFTVLVAGNLQPIIQFLRHFRNLPHADPFVFNWWTPSRVIHDCLPDSDPVSLINEFPFFSFYHGDLHPHLLAMPFSLMFAGFVVHMIKTMSKTDRPFGFDFPTPIARFLLTAWSLGLLIWINPFDFAGWSVFLVVALLIGAMRDKRSTRWYLSMIRGIGVWIGLTFAALIAVFPFILNYDLPTAGQNEFIIGLSEFRTNIIEFLLIWGFPLTIAAVWIILYVLSSRKKLKADARFILDALLWTALGVSILISGGLVGGILIFSAGVLLFSLFRRRKSASGATAHTFLISGLLLLIACEFFFIRDPYGRALQRMNTVFKFYFIAWILIGLATPYFLRLTLRLYRTPLSRTLYSGAVLAFLLACAAYPILATNVRLNEYSQSGLGKPDYDGMRFLKRDYPGDLEAIKWLSKNIEPGTVILEAAGLPYGYYGRLSVFSPARAVIGWSNHQSVWRGGDFQAIVNNVAQIYSNTSIAETNGLLRKYNVQLVCIGWLERQDYPEAGLQKFAAAYPVVFNSTDGNTIIYQVADRWKLDK